MSGPEIVVLPDADAAGRDAAERIARILASAVAERSRAVLATTGGSTALAIYPRLATRPLREAIPWSGVEIWWGDDRFVPRDHPLSNVRPLDDLLLSYAARSAESGTGATGIDVDLGSEPSVPLPLGNIRPFPTGIAIGRGEGPDACAAAYEARLRERLAGDAARWPVFDLVLLGVGPDGHILSVFPDSSAFDSDAWALGIPAPTHVEPHVPRVTLNPGIVGAARSVLVLATGGGKADVLGRILADPPAEGADPRRLPARLAVRPGATWILDEAAAAQLRR